MSGRRVIHRIRKASVEATVMRRIMEQSVGIRCNEITKGVRNVRKTRNASDQDEVSKVRVIHRIRTDSVGMTRNV